MVIIMANKIDYKRIDFRIDDNNIPYLQVELNASEIEKYRKQFEKGININLVPL